MRYLITFFLLALLFVTACEKKQETLPGQQGKSASVPAPKTEQKVTVWDGKVYSDPSKYKEGMCPLVDQAMIFSKPPIDPSLQAADYWCRIARLPKPKPGASLPPSPQIPVLVELPNNKVFYGLIDRNDLDKAKDACTAISTLLPVIIGDTRDALILSRMSASSCNSLSKELTRDNPMVVIGATTVIGSGVVDDFAKLVQQQPELASTGKIVEDLNNKISDTIRDAVKKPIDWAIKNPRDAFTVMQPTLTAVSSEQARALAEKTIGFLVAAGAPKDQINQAANSIGGDAGKALQAAATVIIPPTPDAVTETAKRTAQNVMKQAERSADDLRRSDANPGNWFHR